MKQALLVGMIGLVVAACGSSDPNAVRLATGPKPEPNYCAYTQYNEGELVEDRSAGTAYKVSEDYIIPLTWPDGFTARRSGESIEVLAPDGTVWAVTGRRYRFNGPASPSWTGPGCFIEIDQAQRVASPRGDREGGVES